MAFFPLDEQLALREAHYSAGIARLLTRLSGVLPYDQVRQVLQEVGGLQVSCSSIWRCVQRWGAAFEKQLAAEEEAAKTATHSWQPAPKADPARKRMGVAIDGGMVFILGEGWKEFKAGCMFELEPHRERDPLTGDWGTYGRAVHKSYVAHLGTPEPLGWRLWSEGQRRGWDAAAATQVLGDGAPWIWNLAAEHFPESNLAVDWFHATEHLGVAKQTLHPEDSAVATRWYNHWKTALYQGQAQMLAHELRQAAQQHPHQAADLERAAGYFQHNHDRMQYQELREEGWAIGSGVIEGGIKQFKHRFTGPGMRWKRQGAENLFPICAAVLTGPERFQELWNKAYNSPPE